MNISLTAFAEASAAKRTAKIHTNFYYAKNKMFFVKNFKAQAHPARTPCSRALLDPGAQHVR
jgi:hypothetical protein